MAISSKTLAGPQDKMDIAQRRDALLLRLLKAPPEPRAKLVKRRKIAKKKSQR